MSVKRPEKRDDLVQSFDALALSGKKRDPNTQPNDKVPRHKVPSKDGSFVGGFVPGFNFGGGGSAYPTHNGWKPSPLRRASGDNPFTFGELSRPFAFAGDIPPSASLPRPPNAVSMPVPDGQSQSLTMQHALGTPPRFGLMPPGPQTPPSRPVSTSVLPPPASLSSSISSKPAVKVSPIRRRAASEPPSPSTPSKSGTVQCSGVTKVGKQCTRQIKAAPALSVSHPNAQIERFCHQHSKELLGVAGFYSHKVADAYIKFEDWIPDYLQPDTQVALRVEMEKPRSQADVPGYIYTFEIRDPDTPKKVHLKVGRAVNLVKRIDQWGKQCGSKEQVLRGWWPGAVEDDDGDAAANGSLMKGRVKAGEKGPLCHRLERLVHLELADLAVNAPYLDADFLKPKKKDAGDSGTSTPSKKPPGSPAGKKLLDKPCPDCGAVHKEIFSLTRAERGPYKGKEWDLLVKPVIDKWGGFVSAYV